MSCILFLGPSLGRAEIAATLEAEIRPPAAAGDLLAAARRRPRAIGLIDGYFDGRLPVWHKEALWAMAQGIHLFGAASMGALRAAELHGFGMQGVGAIFAAYRDGTIEGDDEVAVAHGPPELGYVAVSEALVNVRATLARALAEAVLAPDAAQAVLATAASMPYRARSWPALLAALPAQLTAVAEELRAWLPGGRVDLKAQDARALVAAMAAFLATDPPPLRVGYRLAWTDAWDVLYRQPLAGAGGEPVLEELRLAVEELAAVRRAALVRLLAEREAERCRLEVSRAQTTAVLDRLRSRHGLWRQAELARWAATNGLDAAGLDRLAAGEALLERLADEAGPALEEAMLAELRVSGRYGPLAGRAAAKERSLAEAGLDGPGGATPAGTDLAAALAALTGRVEELAGDADPVRFLGFADRMALERAVLREALFAGMVRAKDGGATATATQAQPAGSNGAKRER